MRPFLIQNKNDYPSLPVPTSFWKAENNTNDFFGVNNGVAGGGLSYDNSIFQAFAFNGTDAYLDLSSIGNPGSAAFSWSFWMYPHSVPADWFSAIYVMGRDSSNTGQGWKTDLINQSLNSIGLQVWGTWDFPDYPGNQSIKITANTLNFITLASAAAGGNCKLYINNQLAGTVTRGAISDGGVTRFGKSSAASDSPFDGFIGKIRFFANKELSATEEAQLWNGGVPI